MGPEFARQGWVHKVALPWKSSVIKNNKNKKRRRREKSVGFFALPLCMKMASPDGRKLMQNLDEINQFFVLEEN